MTIEVNFSTQRKSTNFTTKDEQPVFKLQANQSNKNSKPVLDVLPFYYHSLFRLTAEKVQPKGTSVEHENQDQTRTNRKDQTQSREQEPAEHFELLQLQRVPR